MSASRGVAALAILAGFVQGQPAPAGLPRFDRSLLLETTSETSANVSIGDINGDGTLDIVLAKGRHWPLRDRVLPGDGRGGFGPAYDLGEAEDRSYSGKLIDLDGDGDLDVVVSNDKPDPKRTYLNDGRGRFTAGSTFGQAEWETRNAAVADLNGDKLPDIIVANRFDTGSASYVCLNRGGGRFDENCVAVSPYPSTTIAPADFNGDGLIDLAVPHRQRGQSYIYLNAGNATFPEARRIPFGPADSHIRTAEAADFNGDGLMDLAVTEEARGVSVFLGRKDHTFAPPVLLADAKPVPYAIAIADLNRDGRMDIVVGHMQAKPAVYLNSGDGRRYTRVVFGDDKGDAYGFAIDDVDGDGHLDIAIARSDAPNVLYFGGR